MAEGILRSAACAASRTRNRLSPRNGRIALATSGLLLDSSRSKT